MPALAVVAVVHCASNAKRTKDPQGMFSPGKYEQKDGLPRASNIFFPYPCGLCEAQELPLATSVPDSAERKMAGGD